MVFLSNCLPMTLGFIERSTMVMTQPSCKLHWANTWQLSVSVTIICCITCRPILNIDYSVGNVNYSLVGSVLLSADFCRELSVAATSESNLSVSQRIFDTDEVCIYKCTYNFVACVMFMLCVVQHRHKHNF